MSDDLSEATLARILQALAKPHPPVVLFPDAIRYWYEGGQVRWEVVRPDWQELYKTDEQKVWEAG